MQRIYRGYPQGLWAASAAWGRNLEYGTYEDRGQSVSASEYRQESAADAEEKMPAFQDGKKPEGIQEAELRPEPETGLSENGAADISAGSAKEEKNKKTEETQDSGVSGTERSDAVSGTAFCASSGPETSGYEATGVNLELIDADVSRESGPQRERAVSFQELALGQAEAGGKAGQLEPYMVYGKEERAAVPERPQAVRMEMEYFKNMYPASVRGRQTLVDEACDRMDYGGSPMYDEYPDRVMILGIRDGICKNACENGMEEERDLTQILLVNEMNRRRVMKKN